MTCSESARTDIWHPIRIQASELTAPELNRSHFPSPLARPSRCTYIAWLPCKSNRRHAYTMSVYLPVCSRDDRHCSKACMILCAPGVNQKVSLRMGTRPLTEDRVKRQALRDLDCHWLQPGGFVLFLRDGHASQGGSRTAIGGRGQGFRRPTGRGWD